MDQPVARKRPLRGKRHVIGSLGQIEHARVYAAVRQPPRRKDNHTPTAAETGVLRLGVDAACAARAEHKALLRGQRADAPGKAPGAFIWLPRADDADARQLQQRRLTPQEEHQRRTIPQQRAKRRRIARRDACEREDAPPLRRGEIGMERCLPREQIFDALRLLRRITRDGSDPSPSGRAADLLRRVRGRAPAPPVCGTAHSSAGGWIHRPGCCTAAASPPPPLSTAEPAARGRRLRLFPLGLDQRAVLQKAHGLHLIVRIFRDLIQLGLLREGAEDRDGNALASSRGPCGRCGGCSTRSPPGCRS